MERRVWVIDRLGDVPRSEMRLWSIGDVEHYIALPLNDNGQPVELTSQGYWHVADDIEQAIGDPSVFEVVSSTDYKYEGFWIRFSQWIEIHKSLQVLWTSMGRGRSTVHWFNRAEIVEATRRFSTPCVLCRSLVGDLEFVDVKVPFCRGVEVLEENVRWSSCADCKAVLNERVRKQWRIAFHEAWLQAEEARRTVSQLRKVARLLGRSRKAIREQNPEVLASLQAEFARESSSPV